MLTRILNNPRACGTGRTNACIEWARRLPVMVNTKYRGVIIVGDHPQVRLVEEQLQIRDIKDIKVLSIKEHILDAYQLPAIFDTTAVVSLEEHYLKKMSNLGKVNDQLRIKISELERDRSRMANLILEAVEKVLNSRASKNLKKYFMGIRIV